MTGFEELETRVSRGFGWLLARELAGQTDAYYERAFTAWEKLLRLYETAKEEHDRTSGFPL